MARSVAKNSTEEKKPLNKENFKRLTSIFKYLRPYTHQFTFGMICLFAGSGVLLLFPFLAGKLLNAANGEEMWLGLGINQITLLLLAVLLVQSFFSFFRVYLFGIVSEKGMADIRQNIYSKLVTLPMAFYDKRRTGELMSRITSDVSLLQETFSTTLAELIRQIITLIGALTFIFWSIPELSLFMLATFPVAIIIAMVFGRFIRRLSKETQDKLANANIIVEETLQSIQMVKAFTSELTEVLRYRRSLDEGVKTAINTAKYRGLFIGFIILALFGGIVGVLWKGATMVQSGTFVGDLLAFIMFTAFIGGSIAGLGSIYGSIQKAIGASERVLEIIGEKGEMELQTTLSSKKEISGAIEFENVGFSYPTRSDIKVLSNINLHIASGERVAFVGHSGAGKSTLIQLLMRFYRVDTGKIKVSGFNIESYNLTDYRSNIGIVPQEVILFGGTIRENIGYGKPLASEEEIIEAAKKANAFEFIDGFPEKLDTKVGERGMKLSGGQKQRIAIARAILKDPKILILDEATSSLDAESESQVQGALNELMKNRTTIIIAHRLSTIRNVDKIYVLNEGNILEAGKHEELIQNEKGLYNNLVKLQFQEVE